MERILIMGDALFEGLPGMPDGVEPMMFEDAHLATRTRHHKQKIVLYFSAMRHFAGSLPKVSYQQFDPKGLGMLGELAEMDLAKLWLYEPNDRFFLPSLKKALPKVEIELVPSPAFMTSRSEWNNYRSSSKRLLMGDFYQRQRKKNKILVKNGEPVGGKWSYDEENRRAFPKGFQDPTLHWKRPDKVTKSVISLVEKHFPDHPGSATDFCYPVTHEGAREWLDDFLETRLDDFGPYEDSLSKTHRTGHHSILTPMLNCGLLTPEQVILATLNQAKSREIPLNSLEGFIRQIIGWREFIKKTDDLYGELGYVLSEPGTQLPAYTMEAKKGLNFFNHQRRLGPQWYAGETGLPPLDIVIERANRHAYAHHIERLMVVGSAMLMSEIHPSDVHRWFMEMFIDSADWVMAPNALGMSQFADGGLFATKPYLSGSAYLLKMGDYQSGPWTEVWDGLYWGIIDQHRDFFAKNPRMSMMVKMLERLNSARREKIFTARENWVNLMTH